MSRAYVHAVGIFFSAAAVAAGIFLLSSSSVGQGFRTSAAPLASVAADADRAPASPKLTTLAFVGDIMLDRSVRKSVMNNFSGDYAALFSGVKPLAGADILFANLEGPVSDIGADRHNLYSFRMATSTLPVLAAAGFDAFSLANNHIGDWGRGAFEDTLARVKAAGIAAVGAGLTRAEAEEPRIIERNGIRFGFLGFTDVGPDWLEATDDPDKYPSGILLAGDTDLSGIVARAAAKSDVLVVSVHWGIEYETHSDARQQRLGRAMIDAGARLVIGTHPHVREEVEEYQGGLIAYSLGNFIFDQYFSPEVMKGGLLLVTFDGKNIAGSQMKTVNISWQSQPSVN